MDEQKLKSFIKSEITTAIGYQGGDVTDDRADGMDYFLGEKKGPFAEIDDDHSSVVSRDVQEVVELMMPALMRTFSTDEIVTFDPVGREDIPLAQQETDYTRYVFFKKNPGWLILYNWIKDALIQKNGIIKVVREEEEEVEEIPLENIDELQYAMLSEEMDLKQATPKHVMPDGTLMEGEMEGYPTVYDAVFEKKEVKGEFKVYNVAPENFGINADHDSIVVNDCNFCYERSDRTLSELIEAGYEKELVMSLPTGQESLSEEELARKNLSEEQLQDDSMDMSMRTVEVYECYARVDDDGDGIAERRRIVFAGNEILENEEVDRFPFIAITPIILPHKFFGLSMYDRVGDIQEINTALWRNGLDSIYGTVNPRDAINDKVNQDSYTAGGFAPIIIEDDTPPQNCVHTVSKQPVVQEVFQMLEYTARIRESRTGVSQMADLADDLLANNKGDMSVAKVMSVSEQQVELIARTFAETGIKELFLALHELIMKFPDQQEVIELRGQWVEVNPNEWRERKNLTVKVGLGTEDKFKQLAGIQNVVSQQMAFLEQGMADILVDEASIYRAQKDLAKFADLHAGEYFLDPNEVVGQDPQSGMPITRAQAVKQQRAQQAQQQQNPLAEAEKIKADAKIYVAQMQKNFDAQLEQYKEENKKSVEMLKAQLKDNQLSKEMQAELITQAADRAAENARAILDAEIKLLVEGLKQDIGKPGVGAEVVRLYDRETGELL